MAVQKICQDFEISAKCWLPFGFVKGFIGRLYLNKFTGIIQIANATGGFSESGRWILSYGTGSSNRLIDGG